MLLFRRTTPLTRSTEEARACRGLKTPSSRARPQTPTPRASRAVSRAVVSRRRDFTSTTHPRPRYPFPCRRLLRWRRTLRGCVAPQGLSLWPVFVVS